MDDRGQRRRIEQLERRLGAVERQASKMPIRVGGSVAGDAAPEETLIIRNPLTFDGSVNITSIITWHNRTLSNPAAYGTLSNEVEVKDNDQTLVVPDGEYIAYATGRWTFPSGTDTRGANIAFAADTPSGGGGSLYIFSPDQTRGKVQTYQWITIKNVEPSGREWPHIRLFMGGSCQTDESWSLGQTGVADGQVIIWRLFDHIL